MGNFMVQDALMLSGLHNLMVHPWCKGVVDSKNNYSYEQNGGNQSHHKAKMEKYNRKKMHICEVSDKHSCLIHYHQLC